jgi:hypothetical protein
MGRPTSPSERTVGLTWAGNRNASLLHTHARCVGITNLQTRVVATGTAQHARSGGGAPACVAAWSSPLLTFRQERISGLAVTGKKKAEALPLLWGAWHPQGRSV